jgi:hypothetical protein
MRASSFKDKVKQQRRAQKVLLGELQGPGASEHGVTSPTFRRASYTAPSASTEPGTGRRTWRAAQIERDHLAVTCLLDSGGVSQAGGVEAASRPSSKAVSQHTPPRRPIQRLQLALYLNPL